MCLSQYFLPIPGPEIGKIYVEMRVISRQFVAQARTATTFGVIYDIRREGVVCGTKVQKHGYGAARQAVRLASAGAGRGSVMCLV